MSAPVQSSPDKSSRIEQHTIYQIPLDQRHGKAHQLFTLWFGANLNVLTVVTGALATTIFHQSFLSAVVAILLGNLVGTIFMALHAAQGPRLGVPQMVQSRGQFGAKGAGFVVALVAFMYVGYAATAFVTGGQSVHLIIPALSQHPAIIAIAAISLAAAIFGHDLIHFGSRLLQDGVHGRALAARLRTLCFRLFTLSAAGLRTAPRLLVLLLGHDARCRAADDSRRHDRTGRDRRQRRNRHRSTHRTARRFLHHAAPRTRCRRGGCHLSLWRRARHDHPRSYSPPALAHHPSR